MNLGYTFSAIFSMMLVVLTGKRCMNPSFRRDVDIRLIRLIYFVGVYCAMDAMWGVMYFGYISSQLLFTIVCYGVYTTAGLVSLCWATYVVDYMGAGKRAVAVMKTLAAILICFELLILVSNSFSYDVFFINSEGVFYSGTGRMWLQLLQSVNFLMILVLGMGRLASEHGQDRSNLLKILFCALLPGIFGIGQIILIDVAMYSMGFTLAIGTIFMYDIAINIVNQMDIHYKQESEEQNSIINALTGDFSTIYSVDMQTGGFIIYNKSGDGNALQKADNSSLDYFKVAVEKGIRMICKDDQETFLLLMDRDIIKRRLEREGRFSLVLRVHFGFVTKYIEYRFSDSIIGGRERLIVGVYDVDMAYRKKLKADEQMRSSQERQLALEEEAQMLEKAAYRDIMTGLYNRRAYEDYVAEVKGVPDNEEFTYVSLDVNGLKGVNDDLGHEAGDELIKGAAFCMKKAMGDYGRIYRHGGDEFSAILHVPGDRLRDIFEAFDRTLADYKGSLINEISVSYGYVTAAESGMIPIEEMVKLADKRMYEAKNLHYSRKGIDRRGQQEAYEAIRRSYLKILKVDLKTDSFVTVYIDEGEDSKEKGFNFVASKWIYDFAVSGNIHTDDVENFLEHLTLDGIRDHFREGKERIAVHYRRKTGEDYGNALLELIPSEGFSEESQIVFLYVKNIY